MIQFAATEIYKMSNDYWNPACETVYKNHRLQPYPLTWSEVLEMKKKNCLKAIGR